MFLNKDNAPSFIKVCMALLYPFICTYFYDYFFKIFESISSFFMPFSDNAIFSFVGLAIMLFSPSVALLFWSSIRWKIFCIVAFLSIYTPMIIWVFLMVPCVTDNKCL